MSFKSHWRIIHDDFCATMDDFPFDPQLSKAALKVALSCVIAVMLTYALRIPHAYWAGISVLIMMQPHVAGGLQKGWQRAGGACVGSLLGLIYAGFVAQSPLAFSIFTFLIVAAGTYAGKTLRYGYFCFYGVFHIYIVGVLCIMGGSETGETQAIQGSLYPEHIAFYRAAAVSIGVLVYVVVSLLFKPDFAFDIASKKADDVVLSLKDFLSCFFAQYTGKSIAREDLEKKYSALKKHIAAYRELFRQSRLERRIFFEGDLAVSGEQAAELEKNIDELYRHYSQIRDAGELSYQDNYKDVLTELPVLFGEALASPGNTGKLKEALDRINQTHSRDDAGKLLYKTKDIIVFRSFAAILWKLFRTVSGEFYRVPEGGTKRGFHLNEQVLNESIRGALSILLVFWVWLWFEVPGGGLGMSISVIAIFQVGIMNVQHKGFLRFLGCLAGAATGLFVLLFNIESTVIMSFVLFAVVFFFGYIWAGRPGSAYAGVQAALAFLVCVFNDNGPTTEIDSGIERLTGILLAIVCISLVNNVFMPVDFVGDFRKKLAAFKESLLHNGAILRDALSAGTLVPALSPLDPELLTADVLQLEKDAEISAAESKKFREDIAITAETSCSLAKAAELLREEDTQHFKVKDHYSGIFELLGKEGVEKEIEELKLRVMADAEEIINSGRLFHESIENKLLFSEIYLNKLELLDLLSASGLFTSRQ